MKCKICGQNCNKFVVCYNHRNTKYIDICKIHGETEFINRQCLQCRELKNTIYLITNNCDRLGQVIDKNHYLYPYKSRLTHLTRKYQNKYIQRISKTAGVYGIFVGRVCLYVGQSVNVSNRINQHKENFKIAKYQINGIRLHRKRIDISKIPHKVEYKYYEMAKDYNLSDLVFKTLFKIPKLSNDFEFNELLTYAEQAMIDSYHPKFNRIAARPTKNIM